MRRRPHSRPLRAWGEDWQKARMRALVRDEFRCQEPGCTEDRLRRLEVHHILPRARGGQHDLDNLVTLCRVHHAARHPHLGRVLEREEHHLSYPWREL